MERQMTAENLQDVTNQDIYLLNLQSQDDLYASYMPHIKGGGLFVRTEKNYQLGEEIFIALKLKSSAEKLSVVGKVVWVTPKCAQDGKAAGVGVQFVGENAADIQAKIETLLVGLLNSDKHTDTL